MLPNFRDPAVYSPVPDHERRRVRVGLGLPADLPLRPRPACAPEKRPDLALDVASNVPDAVFALAGEGPLAAGLRDKANQSGVHLLGSIADPAPLIASADVVLVTSDTEGVPGVLIEGGVVAGVPAVTTDVGFASDVVIDGHTGRLVPRGTERDWRVLSKKPWPMGRSGVTRH